MELFSYFIVHVRQVSVGRLEYLRLLCHLGFCTLRGALFILGWLRLRANLVSIEKQRKHQDSQTRFPF